MRTENWCGHEIRFVEINGEWWAILKDICDALDLSRSEVGEIIDSECMEMYYGTEILNENGVYAAIFASDHPRARATRVWMSKLLRKHGNSIADYCSL